MFKRVLVILLFFCIILSPVYAEDTNLTELQISPEDIITVQSPDDSSTFVELANMSNCECCSFVIQERDETAFGFRQDGSMNGHGLLLTATQWYGVNVMKQEIDTPYEYFCHAIITEDGWVFSEGGSQYNDSSRAMEQIAATMRANNDISADYLNQAKNILARYGYGHFLIKAPDGRYGVAFANTYFKGLLQVGQFLVVPNYYSYYFSGNYNKYSSNPIDAIIIMCSYESSGYHRKNLMTYDYKVHESEIGVSYGIDIFATNDNGRNVGRSTGNMVTHFYYNGQYHSPNEIPQNPGKVFVATHIFKTTEFKNVIQLISRPYNLVVGVQESIYYRINFIHAARTILFDLGDNVEFISAVTSHGSYKFNPQNHVLYWYTPASGDSRDIIINFRPLSDGNHKLHAEIEAMEESYDLGYYVSPYGAYISTSDVTKYVGGSEGLVVRLADKNNFIPDGEKVAISLNGKTYYREINHDGYVSLAINLASGEYNAVVSYDGKLGKNRTSAKITVKPTAFGKDIEKYYKNGTQYYASFLDTSGNPLKNTAVKFNINGVFYTRNTDANGVAKLNINLAPGKYVITAINTNNDKVSNTILVRPVLVENRDVVKYYRNDTQYTLKVIDGEGNPLSGAKVTFNINGVFYTRTSDENATVKLNINLAPGSYIITATYDGASVSNNIRVLTRLYTHDLFMNCRDGTRFRAVVLNEGGGLMPNQNVTFNINGVFYNRTSDSNGVVSLKINLDAGKYLITSSWNDYAVSNTITVKSN